MMPAAPNPWMARATMNDVEFGAAPHMAEPASNRKMEIMKVALTLKKVYTLPNMSWKAALVSRYALPYQPMSLTELNSLVMAGIAVATISRSNEMRNRLTKTDEIKKNSRRPSGYTISDAAVAVGAKASPLGSDSVTVSTGSNGGSTSVGVSFGAGRAPGSLLFLLKNMALEVATAR